MYTKMLSFPVFFQMILAEYERIKLKIQHPIEQLMIPWLANVDDAIQPGLMLLTWTSLNIEKYINTVFDKLGKSLSSSSDFCLFVSIRLQVPLLSLLSLI